jgi:drug/metabolite transporter (DMT)-like permease
VVSTYAYINTVVAILIGWLWLHEELDANIALAAGLTIIGVWMVTKTTKQS